MDIPWCTEKVLLKQTVDEIETRPHQWYISSLNRTKIQNTEGLNRGRQRHSMILKNKWKIAKYRKAY